MSALTKEIFSVAVSGTADELNAPTCFDGKNAWFTLDGSPASTSKIVVVNFWGPYRDLDNTAYPRWAEPATDETTIEQMGPKLQIVTYINLTKKVKQFLQRAPNVVTAVCTDDTWINISTIDYTIISSTFTPKQPPSLPPLFSPPSSFTFNDHTLSNITRSISPNGEILNYCAISPTRYVIVGEPFMMSDSQLLYNAISLRRDDNTQVTSRAIGGTAQFMPRYVAYANNRLYIGSFNDNLVRVVNANTLGFIKNISVNRDVEEIFAYDNNVYVSSRGGVFSVIRPDDSVEHLGGELTRDKYFTDMFTITDAKHYGIPEDSIGRYDAGHTVWEVKPRMDEDDKIIGYDVRYYKKDTRTGKSFDLFTLNIKSCVYTPELKYEYYDGSNITPVTVPPHLLFLEGSYVRAIRFPHIYYGGAVKQYGGVAAIQTGFNYKGDNI